MYEPWIGSKVREGMLVGGRVEGYKGENKNGTTVRAKSIKYIKKIKI